jgi:hypothetical protein
MFGEEAADFLIVIRGRILDDLFKRFIRNLLKSQPATGRSEKGRCRMVFGIPIDRFSFHDPFDQGRNKMSL